MGESSLFSYTSLATASQVHSEVRLLGDSKPSQIGNGDKSCLFSKGLAQWGGGRTRL